MQCMLVLTFGLACASAVRISDVTHLRRGGQSVKMNPEAAAITLAAVEDEWLQQAVTFAGCNATAEDCTATADHFQKSCQTVVGATIRGSDGDKSNVADYLEDVCGKDALQGARHELCIGLTQALSLAMTEDQLYNREDLDLKELCSGFLTHGFLAKTAAGEVARQKQLRKETEEREQQAAADAQKKAEEEKQAEEDARKKAEADAASKAAAEKRAEAEAQAAEAKQKAQEAVAAEEAQRLAQEQANMTAAKAQEIATHANVSSDAIAGIAVAIPAAYSTAAIPAANSTALIPAANSTEAATPVNTTLNTTHMKSQLHLHQI